MFASKIARAQAKAAATPALLQRGIDDQAMLRPRARRANDGQNKSGTDQSEAHTADFTPYAAAPVPSWNFGKTPLLASLAPRNFTPPGGRVLQRVCACNHTMAGGECDECREKRDYSIFTGFWYGSRGAFIV
jgi:hypothetical protein